MSKSKRILSFLLAAVMLMSVTSVMAHGYAAYKDAALTTYDDLDKPVVTLDQCSSMVLDYVDVVLKEQNMIIDLSVLGELRLNSVDNALTDIYNLFTSITFTLFKWMLGDLQNLDVSALSSRRRATAGTNSDTNVIYSLVEFLADSDNRDVIAKFIDGSINLGIASSFVDLGDLNVNKMVKEMLYGLAYPEVETPPDPITETADAMIQKVITDLFQGKLDPETGEYDGIAPALVPYIDIVNTTVPAYEFVDTLLQQAWNLVVVPLLNNEVKVYIRQLCGVVYNPLNPDDPGDESNLNEYAQILNIHYVIPTYNFPPVSAGTFGLVSELNNLIGSLVDEMTVSYNSWTMGSNANLLPNLTAAAKYVLTLTGNAFFAEYVDVATPAEIAAMNDQQLFSYILRSVLNASVDELWIPADADTLVEVVWYVLKNELAGKLPANDYSAQPKTLEGVLFMIGDLAAYFLNEVADMNPANGALPGEGLIAYGQGLDATLLAMTNWARTNYGALFNATFSTTNAWSAIDTLLFSILLQANWLPASVNGSSYELIVNRVIRDILNLNISNIFALFDKRADSELASKTIKKILIDTFARIVNSIFPSSVATTFTTFEAMLANSALQLIVKNILGQLGTRKIPIMSVLIPLLAQAVGKNAPQAYEDPVIALPEVISASTTFEIRNDSTGINTGYSDSNGNFTRDNLYKISIVSVTSDIPAITPTNLAGTVINGGSAVNCTLSGTFAANQQLMVTITYNVLTQDGSVLTQTPLSQRAFAYISSVVDDGTKGVTVDNGNTNIKMTFKNIYCNQNYTLSNLAAQDQFVFSRPSTTTDNLSASTISRSAATANATLVANGITAAAFTNISTTKDGGSWNVPVFVVSPTATRPADGAYSSTFTYSAQKTTLFGSSETFNVTHYVVFYNDYDLPSILDGAIGANRDPNNYSDAAAWDDYIAALKNAVAIQFRPRVASTFMSIQGAGYQTAAEWLTEAVETLEASAISAGVEPLKTAIDAIEPSNKGLEYDDPLYKYFDSDDYVSYTFANYEKERDNAYAIWASQQLPEEPVAPPPGATPEQIAAYNAAYAKWVTDYAAALAARKPVNSTTVAYAKHRFDIYAARLVEVQAVKARLNEAVLFVQANMPVQANFTPASWAVFQRAYAFAQSVNAQSATATQGFTNYVLEQSKVNTAREKLLEAWKKLIPAADYTQLLALIAQAQGLTQSDWTPASWAAMVAKLNEALAVPLGMSNTQSHQDMIDAAAAALQTAINNLVTAVVNVFVTPTAPTTTVDAITRLIYGVGEGVGAEGYVGPSNPAGMLNFIYSDGGPGTGTRIDLIVNAVVKESFWVVVFGDVNGDANIDSSDAGIIVDFENFMIEWDPALQNFLFKASDINGDGNVDSSDAGILVDVENFMLLIDQADGSVTPL